MKLKHTLLASLARFSKTRYKEMQLRSFGISAKKYTKKMMPLSYIKTTRVRSIIHAIQNFIGLYCANGIP